MVLANARRIKNRKLLQAAGPQKEIYNRNLLWNDPLEVVAQKAACAFMSKQIIHGRS